MVGTDNWTIINDRKELDLHDAQGLQNEFGYIMFMI